MPLGHMLFVTINIFFDDTVDIYKTFICGVFFVVDMSWFESYRSSIKNHLLVMILKDLTSVHCYESA